MAHKLNQYTHMFVAYEMPDGSVFHAYPLNTGSAKVFEEAEDYERQGMKNVRILTEQVSWYGKNGKRKREIIDSVTLAQAKAITEEMLSQLPAFLRD